MSDSPETPSSELQASSYVGFDCEWTYFPTFCNLRLNVSLTKRVPASIPVFRHLTAITRQIEHKLLKRGFQFNVMVVGKSLDHLLYIGDSHVLNVW